MSLLAIVLVSALEIPPPPDTYFDCPTGQAVFHDPRVSIADYTAGDYEIHLYTQPRCSFVQDGPAQSHDSTGIKVLKSGKEVYRYAGYNLRVGYPQPSNLPVDAVLMKPGDDITGEGVPELLISEWSGRNRCCLTLHLFRLGTELTHLQDIPLLDADESAFVRREGYKGLVLGTWDYSDFTGFPFKRDGSPAGRAYLSFQQGRYQPDLALMKADAPAASVLEKCATQFKQSRSWKSHVNAGQPMGMWYYATDLIYTGHADAAWRFLDSAWGGSKADKKRYVGDYKQRLTKSIYYPELMRLQKTPLTDAGQKIDWEKHCFDYMHG